MSTTTGRRPRAQMEGCVALHPQAPGPGAEKLRWHPQRVFDWARVLVSTCWRCRAVAYELVSVGGEYAIRRTDATLSAPQRAETPRVGRRLAERWWSGLLLYGGAE